MFLNQKKFFKKIKTFFFFIIALYRFYRFKDILDFETFEFISIKKIFKNLKNVKNVVKKENSWTQLFKNYKIKISSPKFLYKSKFNQGFLNEKNNGLSITNLRKETNISGSIFSHIKNCRIVNDTLLVLIDKNLSLTEGYADERWAKFQLNKWPKSHHNSKSLINLNGKKYIHKRVKVYKKNIQVKKIKQKALYLSTREDDQVFHWTFDNLPRLYCLEKFSKLQSLPLILKNPLSKFQKETLKLLNIKNKLIFLNEKDALMDNLYFSSIPSPPVLNKHLILWLRKKFLNNISKKHYFDKKKFAKKIFISRNDTGHRKILNEDDLTSRLKKEGYVVYELSKLKLYEQIILFSRCEEVVMPHGAGGVHLMFVSKKAKIIEIHSPTQPNNSMYCISQCLNNRHLIAMGNNAINDHKKNYYIEVDKFMNSYKKDF